MAEVFNINTDDIIDTAVKEAFNSLGTESIIIKKQYFTEIQKELKDISIYFTTAQKVSQYKKASKLNNPYAPEYGFSQSEIAY